VLIAKVIIKAGIDVAKKLGRVGGRKRKMTKSKIVLIKNY
jgi:hypothetical protein